MKAGVPELLFMTATGTPFGLEHRHWCQFRKRMMKVLNKVKSFSKWPEGKAEAEKETGTAVLPTSNFVKDTKQALSRTYVDTIYVISLRGSQ